MRFPRKLVAVALMGVQVFLIAVWFATVFRLFSWPAALFNIASVLGAMFILFTAEGLELAVSALLEQGPEWIGDSGASRVWREIYGDPQTFFSTRQIFVAGVITWMTSTTTFPFVFVPFMGQVNRASSVDIPSLFSVILTTLTVLWWSQVLPKQLSVRNPEAFFSWARWLCRIIKYISKFDLMAPVDMTLSMIPSPSRPALRPSGLDVYRYNLASERVSRDRDTVRLVINENENVTFTKQSLLLLMNGNTVCGGRDRLALWETIPAVALRATIRVWVGVLTLPRRIDRYITVLDDLFDVGLKAEWPPCLPDRVTRIVRDEATHWMQRARVQVNRDGLDGQNLGWQIDGPPLPGGVCRSGENNAAVLMYRVDAMLACGALRDCGLMTSIVLPQRRQTFSIIASPELEQVCLVRSGALTDRKIIKPDRDRHASTAIVEIEYPRLGDHYSLCWSSADRP